MLHKGFSVLSTLSTLSTLFLSVFKLQKIQLVSARLKIQWHGREKVLRSELQDIWAIVFGFTPLTPKKQENK